MLDGFHDRLVRIKMGQSETRVVGANSWTPRAQARDMIPDLGLDLAARVRPAADQRQVSTLPLCGSLMGAAMGGESCSKGPRAPAVDPAEPARHLLRVGYYLPDTHPA
jgi:hypothetical protein